MQPWEKIIYLWVSSGSLVAFENVDIQFTLQSQMDLQVMKLVQFFLFGLPQP